MNRRVALGLRLYRALASAFPYEFQCAYGDELLLTTEDAIEDIWRRHGMFGLGRLLLDIAIRVAAEHLAELRQDIRYGLRSLRSSLGFTAVALISLTLGIGVASSAFSEMNGFVLRDVPGAARPGELVLLDRAVPFPSYQAYRQRSDLFSDSFAYLAGVPVGVSFSGHTERVWGHIVTPSYFATLGVAPAMGRFFAADEAAPAVVVSYRFWQTELGGEAGAIGREVRINGQLCRIIGVGPKDFLGASPMFAVADLFLPVSADPRMAPELGDHVLERHDISRFRMEARLRPGVAPERAEAALDTMARQIERAYGEKDETHKRRRFQLLPAGKVMPVKKQDTGFIRVFFSLLGGAILLIACANIANMTLARAAERRKEIAVRLAIGAGRARLVRQLLTESMLIAVSAGALGFMLSMWIMRQASNMRMPYTVPAVLHLEPDGRCLLFTLALTILTGLAFGLVPALRATRTDLTPALKEGGAVRFGRYRRLNSRNALVVAQITASLTLLLITGFLVIGYGRITDLNVGFEANNLYLVSIDPLRDGYSAQQAEVFFDRLLDRMERLPFVVAATLTTHSPMESIGYPVAALSTDVDSSGTRKIHVARRFIVGRRYFETVGIPILAGRAFRKEDEAKERHSAIVSERLAGVLWPGENAIGRHLEMGDDAAPSSGLSPSAGSGPVLEALRQYEIVGVARNVRDGLQPLQKSAFPEIYLPLRLDTYAQPQLHGLTLMVRTRPGAGNVTAVRREIAAVDPNVTPFHPRTMTDQVAGIMAPVHDAEATFAVVGVFGLILAAVGLAGVTAYSVARRAREIGIRMALGARRADVLGLVMREGATLVATGTVFGLAGAWAGMRALAGMMAEVAQTADSSTSDPALLLGAPLLLATLALGACYVPARKSMRIDPAVTLRQE